MFAIPLLKDLDNLTLVIWMKSWLELKACLTFDDWKLFISRSSLCNAVGELTVRVFLASEFITVSLWIRRI